MITSKVRIRAGSIIAPLHDVIRIVEDFAVIDNLSGGRVDVSFASGWHPNDFVFRPELYQSRREVTYTLVDGVRRLWRGDNADRINGHGLKVSLAVHPYALGNRNCRSGLPRLATQRHFVLLVN